MTSTNPTSRRGRPARNSQTGSGRKRFVTTAAAAEYLSVSDRTVRKMIAEGRLAGYRNGKIIRVDMNEVEQCLQPFGGNVGGDAA